MKKPKFLKKWMVYAFFFVWSSLLTFINLVTLSDLIAKPEPNKRVYAIIFQVVMFAILAGGTAVETVHCFSDELEDDQEF